MTLSAAIRRAPGTVCLVFGIALAPVANAADQRPAPAPAAVCEEPALAPAITSIPDRSDAPTTIYAEAFDAGADRLGRAIGRVELFRADQYLSSEVVHYDPRDRRVTFPSPLVYEDSQIRISASSGLFGFTEESGDFNDVAFDLVGSSAHGEAEQVHLTGGNRSELRRIWFTTCPGDDPEWQLSAAELELKHDEGVGVARNARLQLGKVPVLYVPWISFPIDDRRKSGFLYPFISTANDNGLEFGIPYYWNIAPNMDATLTPRYYTDRGFMASGEYRLMTRRTGTELVGHYLFDDKKTGEDRWHVIGRFNAALAPRWRAGARLEQVSDQDYFQDFGGNLASTSRQFLRSDGSIEGSGRYWIFSALVDDFQVLDEAVGLDREPYSRLPRLAYFLDAPLGDKGLQATLDSELVYFDRELGVVGARLDLYPRLMWNLNRHWGFLRASGGYRYTRYDLDWRGEARDDAPDRGTPIVSLDGGMYFERALAGGGLQTLEPRLYYLYVPFEDQAALPDFDTRELTFGFAQLFHYNRFVGGDRQTDANQITLAATTRSIGGNGGRELWNLSAGQIFYLDSPRVTLEEEVTEELDSSPFIAELNWHPLDRFRGRLELQWNWERSELDVGVVGGDYTFDGGSRLAAEYRFRRDRLDQVDVRWFWPISARWRAFTRVNYSLESSELLEGLIGAEYESCCWALRIAARRYLRDRTGGQRDSIFVELRLKGLGAFGRREPPLFHTPAP